MFRYLLAFLVIATTAVAQDQPGPLQAPAIVAPKEVMGTGKKDDPFVFTSQTKCMLRLSGVPEDAKPDWDLDDAPKDIESIGQALVFSLAEAGGNFQVISKRHYCRCWFVIKSGTDPPAPPLVEDTITKRVKTAMAGHPDDAGKFAAMADELAKALDANTVPTLKAMEIKMQAALTAVGWPVGTYPDMTKLAGELWGAGVSDRELTATDRAAFSKQLRTISKACGEVK